MVEIYKTNNNITRLQYELSDNCWINVTSPTTEDVNYLINVIGIEENFILSAIDPEEASHIDIEDDQTLIVVDVPTSVDPSDGAAPYTTIPMSIIFVKKYIVTIALKEHSFLTGIVSGADRTVSTKMQTRFTLQLLYKVSKRYLAYLKEIDKMSSYTEKKLHQSLKNKEIISLLGIEKSLVYFSTSLKSIELMLNKISRGRVIKMYEEDEEILDDVIIETIQAREMCITYTRTLNSTMDAYSSIISNNLNHAMRTLTSITLVAAVPTVVSSLYGMNIESGIPFDNFWWMPIAIAGTVSILVFLILTRKGMFK